MEYVVLYYDRERGAWKDSLEREREREGHTNVKWIEGLGELLNQYGGEGWRMVSEHVGPPSYVVFFERPRTTEPGGR